MLSKQASRIYRLTHMDEKPITISQASISSWQWYYLKLFDPY